MNRASKIYVAGHGGLVGSAVMRKLTAEGYSNLVVRTRAELDLTDLDDVAEFFAAERPEYVIAAAARVGGILANRDYPAEFIRDNLAIELNVVECAYRHGVKRMLCLGSSCIYPRLAPQPIPESALLSGPLEETNRAYAVAKIAGVELCRAYNRQYGTSFITVMPSNLYGQNDNFDLERSHVIPALLRKFHEAKVEGAGSVTVWGTGTPRREFLHVDDLTAACLLLLGKTDTPEVINVGFGEDITVAELARYIAEVVSFSGRIDFDSSKPDGTPRKLLDSSKMFAFGWRPRVSLREGLAATCAWFRANQGAAAEAATSASVAPT